MANVRTPQFRLSYPQLFEKKTNSLNGKEEYTAQALFPKGTDFSELEKAMVEAATTKFGADKSKWPKLERFWKPMVQKPNKETGKLEWPKGQSEGGFIINLRSDEEIKRVDGKKDPITDPIEFYAGCYCKAFINVFGYEVKKDKAVIKRGVTCKLLAIQKVGEGDSLGGRQPVDIDSAFEQIETDDTHATTTADALFN